MWRVLGVGGGWGGGGGGGGGVGRRAFFSSRTGAGDKGEACAGTWASGKMRYEGVGEREFGLPRVEYHVCGV